MKRPPFKFTSAKPGSSKAQAALVQVYLAAGYSPVDAGRKAAGDVEKGRLRNAVEKCGDEAGERCWGFEQRDVNK